MTGLLLVPALLAALAAGLLVALALGEATDVLHARLERRRSILARTLQQDDGRPEPLSVEELYGLPRNLTPWMLLAALAGLAVSWALLDGPAQTLGLAAGALPLFWKRRLLAQARQQTRRQVAGLIEELRLRLAFGGSLGTTLIRLAQEDRAGLVYARLQAYRGLIAVSGPEETLAQLAAELRSAELRLLLRRVKAARRGGASYHEALRASADEVVQEIHRQAEMEVEAAPLRLMLPILVLLLPPVIALALYPPVYALIASLTGAGPGILP